MKWWGISDLHLSFAKPERRERYAARWLDHANRIEANWRESVGPNDVVLLPGDISMARNHRDLQPDFDWIHRLPGTKVLSAGNHDRWWNEVGAIRSMLRSSMRAVDGDAVAIGGAVICGVRGAAVHSDGVTDRPIHGADREGLRLKSALEAAAVLRPSPDAPLYVLCHYPPFDQHGRPGPSVALIERARATACIYGHLHASAQWARAPQGIVAGVRYVCVAADAIGFRPLQIAPAPTVPRRNFR